MTTRRNASTGELVIDNPVSGAADATSSDAVHCKVYSPFKVYYDGKATSISAESATGPFDILPRHHNFITLLSPCVLAIRNGKEEEAFQIAGGIMHVKANDIVVFLDV